MSVVLTDWFSDEMKTDVAYNANVLCVLNFAAASQQHMWSFINDYWKQPFMLFKTI